MSTDLAALGDQVCVARECVPGCRENISRKHAERGRFASAVNTKEAEAIVGV